MDLESLLNIDRFLLPSNNDSGRPFVIFSEQIIKEYTGLIKSSPDLFSHIPMSILVYREFCELVEYYGESVIKIIRANNSGNLDETYRLFDLMMKEASIFINNFEGAIHIAYRNNEFYRCKFLDKPDLKPKEYFFHAPFELNHKVKSTRFSINGFPSIYLANSLVVGYLETRSQQMETFQAVKFQPTLPISFLNLDYTSPKIELKSTNKPLYDLQLQLKGLIFPLLFTCYCQQNEEGAAAPQEYIIPQLFTHWVRKNNSMFTGIRYPSTRIIGGNFRYNFYNLIVPPQVVLDEGYCSKLKNLFLMSPVCSGSIHQKEIENFFSTKYPGLAPINPDVNTIEWDSLLKLYEETNVGRMEFFMKYEMPSTPIPF